MNFRPNDDDRLFHESSDEGWFRSISPIRFIILIIVVILLIVGAWLLLSPSDRGGSNTNVPLVKADENPYKIKAEDQSVPHVKHQDKLVYGRIREDKNPAAVEHILPDPEPPLAQIKEDMESVQMTERYQPDDLNIERNEPKEEQAPAVVSIADLIEVDEPEEKKAVETPEPEPKPTPKPVSVSKGTVYIQLGSLKTFDIAETEWNRLSKKHTDVLGKFKPKIQKVDLGAEKGIYYRLRAGPFESVDVAKASCTTLKERKVECLVIQ
jgi:cell division protein FtsN